MKTKNYLNSVFFRMENNFIRIIIRSSRIDEPSVYCVECILNYKARFTKSINRFYFTHLDTAYSFIRDNYSFMLDF